MRLPHHLLRHPSGLFHFRLVVPPDLHAALGLRVIKRSLHTRNLAAARIGAWALSASYARVFAMLRDGSMTKPPTLEELLAADARGDLNRYMRNAKTGFVKVDGPEDHARLMEYLAAEERLAKANAAAAAAREEERLAPQRAAAQAQLEHFERNTAQAAGGSSASGFSMRQMITHWETMEVPEMRAGTATARSRVIEAFAQHYGENRPVSAVRRTDVSSWLASLAKHGNTKSTRNTKSSHLKMFFEAAKRAGHYSRELENPAENTEKFTKAEKEDRAENYGWAAFTLPQLQTIFLPENLRRTRMPHTRRAMVLGLYTGARVGEIAQLKVGDFKVEQGVYCVSLSGEVKTSTSKRLIPLHPDLLRLGVLDWVEEQKVRGEVRLFPTVKLDGASGKGNALTKGTTKLLEILGVRLDEGSTNRLGFHSFRDTVIQELQSVDPERLHEERRRAYVGHAPYEKRDNSAHRVHYMRAWKPREIEGLHRGITWGQWLDFDGLATLLAQTDSDAALKARARAEKWKK